MQTILKQTSERMEKAVVAFRGELTSVRTGRANPSILDHVQVDYYSTMTPVNQVASITVVEGTQLVIKPFDRSLLKEIDTAITKANLGFNPQNDGTVIRINIPALTQDRRKELSKIVAKLAEEAKINIRNVRRDSNDSIKKNKELPEDVQKDGQEKVQKLTDDFIKQIEKIADEKAKEIMTV